MGDKTGEAASNLAHQQARSSPFTQTGLQYRLTLSIEEVRTQTVPGESGKLSRKAETSDDLGVTPDKQLTQAPV